MTTTPLPSTRRRIGILAAMPEELQTFLDAMPDETQVVVGGRTFWVGHWAGHDVVAVLSGIGKVAAAITSTLLIQHFNATELWFTGVAGGVGHGVRVGDVVVADQLVQHDMDARPLFPRFELPMKGVSYLATDRALTDRAFAAAQNVADLLMREKQIAGTHLHMHGLQALGVQVPRVHRGLIASGDQFIGSAAASEAILDALPGTLAVEMEGAAVAQVCHEFGVPFVIIRTISDRADDAAHVDFQQFVSSVASPLSHALLWQLMSPSQV